MNSMTGFGRGSAASPLGSLSVELRSVNGRFLDVSVRIPQELGPLEPVARTELQRHLSRGKVLLAVHFEAVPGAGEHYLLNEALISRLEEFCRQRGQEADLSRLLQIPGAVTIQPDGERFEQIEKQFREALGQAVGQLSADRAREGGQLRTVMVELQQQMVQRRRELDGLREAVVGRYRQRLEERLEELLGPRKSSLEPGRLEQEVAIFADKADVAEELARLDAHLEHLEQLLAPGNPEARGRQLDFLNQEILREINTIGSKARDLDTTRQILALKSLAESLKEQIANVE